jgi:hypothetical protein
MDRLMPWRVVAGAVCLRTPLSANAQDQTAPGAASRFVRDVIEHYKQFVSVETTKCLRAGGCGALAVHSADPALLEDFQTDPATYALKSVPSGQSAC